MMNIIELRKELDQLSRIFFSAKSYSYYFKFIHSSKSKHPLVFKTYSFFIESIYHSICVCLVLDLCKLFDNREKFSLEKLCNKMRYGYSKSELINYQSINDFNEMCKMLNHDRISFLLNKLKTTRDKYYAHFDRTRTAFGSIQMSSSEIDELITISENLIKTIELKYFSTSVTYDLTKGEMGYNLFKRLEEWEIYRKKHGLPRNE
jgi:hypothetical protein